MKTDQSILFANYPGYKYLTKWGEIQLSNISLSLSCKVFFFFFYQKSSLLASYCHLESEWWGRKTVTSQHHLLEVFHLKLIEHDLEVAISSHPRKKHPVFWELP